ncbi:MAG TPA: hypothetical protein VIU87_12450 [Mycobacterium sp.]
MDTAKIVADPAGGYLAISHAGDSVNLAVSPDLLTWTFVRTLDAQATQPTIAPLQTGGWLTAVEFNSQRGAGAFLRIRHYASRAALLDGRFDRERTTPRTLSACHEGTPSIRSVTLEPDIDHSRIELEFHYHRDCDVDRQARGNLVDFTGWACTADTELDELLIAAANAVGRPVGGNIGGRDAFAVGQDAYTVYEVQHVKFDFGSWRLYLRNDDTSRVFDLPVNTHAGSTAFANPKVSALTGPSGNPILLVSAFVPSEGAAGGEAGQLIVYSELR